MNENYKTANEKIKKSLEKELVNNGFKEFFIQNRVKSKESILKKSNRKNKYGRHKEITDYSGVRVIVTQLSEMRRCIELVIEKFEVVYYNSKFNPHSFIEDNEFGYRSSHLVVKENDVKTEIQIRTLSQHLWATISHSLDYKNVKKDTIFRRKLFRLSSLLEQVDINVEDLYQTSLTFNESSLMNLGFIDHYSLEYYLSRKERLFAVICYSVKNKRKITKDKHRATSPILYDFVFSLRILDGDEALLTNDKYSIELILITCEKLGLKTIESLKCFLENKIGFSRKIRKAYHISSLSNSTNAFKFFLFLFVFVSKSEQEYIIKEMKFDEYYIKGISEFTNFFREND